METKETTAGNGMMPTAGDETKMNGIVSGTGVNVVEAAEKTSLTATDKKEAEVMEKAELNQDAKPEVILQYREYEANMEAVMERVKSHYYAKGYKRGTIESMQVYVKPEDFTAYYVINDGIVGKVNLF